MSEGTFATLASAEQRTRSQLWCSCRGGGWSHSNYSSYSYDNSGPWKIDSKSTPSHDEWEWHTYLQSAGLRSQCTHIYIYIIYSIHGVFGMVKGSMLDPKGQLWTSRRRRKQTHTGIKLIFFAFMKWPSRAKQGGQGGHFIEASVFDCQNILQRNGGMFNL